MTRHTLEEEAFKEQAETIGFKKTIKCEIVAARLDVDQVAAYPPSIIYTPPVQ